MEVTLSRISPSGIGFGVGNSLGAFGLAERVEFESDKLNQLVTIHLGGNIRYIIGYTVGDSYLSKLRLFDFGE